MGMLSSRGSREHERMALEAWKRGDLAERDRLDARWREDGCDRWWNRLSTTWQLVWIGAAALPFLVGITEARREAAARAAPLATTLPGPGQP